MSTTLPHPDADETSLKRKSDEAIDADVEPKKAKTDEEEHKEPVKKAEEAKVDNLLEFDFVDTIRVTRADLVRMMDKVAEPVILWVHQPDKGPLFSALVPMEHLKTLDTGLDGAELDGTALQLLWDHRTDKATLPLGTKHIAAWLASGPANAALDAFLAKKRAEAMD